ncbi:uncharacterized protein RCC_09165 [Ramularia collo-cygni]|uniref:F-box domain-containing protein n=1 Tax=Ramularia collo-cygni TaxID=112498 RepID=A0A2D3VGZ3_9PEZI|nr:uncharacterized protein RCC_09165 [Ramularia collo-cygni]CZT23451.1 uncharacterized protein RCC_09165 [Ramularia collo-cygni]
MDVAADILAEMALNAPEEPTCHFMRLPLELRKRIYALLLLPPPVTRVHCSILPEIKQCSPGGRFLASTCKPAPSSIRTIGCGTCEWRGGDVHTAIVALNKTIYEEATDVLYESSAAVFYHGVPNQWEQLSDTTRSKVRRLVFVIPLLENYNYFNDVFYTISNAKLIELHFDVDLTRVTGRPIAAQELLWVPEVDGAEIVVDVHIVRAWDEPGSGWEEPITSRRSISEARALELDEKAKEMRLWIIKLLTKVFNEEDRVLVIREN